MTLLHKDRPEKALAGLKSSFIRYVPTEESLSNSLELAEAELVLWITCGLVLVKAMLAINDPETAYSLSSTIFFYFDKEAVQRLLKRRDDIRESYQFEVFSMLAKCCEVKIKIR